MTDDQFHMEVIRQAHALARRGELEEPEARFRLSFLCGRCEDLHAVRGTFMQTMISAQLMIAAGNPVVQIEDEAFVTLVQMDGLDLGRSNDIKAACRAFTEFAERTRS